VAHQRRLVIRHVLRIDRREGKSEIGEERFAAIRRGLTRLDAGTKPARVRERHPVQRVSDDGRISLTPPGIQIITNPAQAGPRPAGRPVEW